MVPPGTFMMGSPKSEGGRSQDEGPQHRVTIARPFAVGKFHVTVDQFAAFASATGYDAGLSCSGWTGSKGDKWRGWSWKNSGFAQSGNHPAVCLNWNDAQAYVAWLSKETGKDYRLLTEAEYEYATRAGSQTRYFFGDDEEELCRYGNGLDRTAQAEIPGASGFRAAPCSDGSAYTSPAGNFAENNFGLYDMYGNALSWLEDCSHDTYDGAPADGSAWTEGNCDRRVLCGGAWYSDPWYLHAAGRFGLTSTLRINSVGFRVARTLSSP
ncbi:MAG: formylglycine-generating enzyme family protein [Alphaproteobacteria bacterium]|nr:formylglycine-generating enzyme family protein [Alphaproteobacteria bacterium]